MKSRIRFRLRHDARALRRVLIDIPAGEVRIRNGAGDRIAVSGTAERHFDGHPRRSKEQEIVDDISAEVVGERR